MKYRYIAVMIVSAFIFTASAAAQNKTANFSGSWELDLSRSKLGERGGSIESQTLTVTQTAKDITIQTTTKRTAPPADATPGTRGGGRMGGGSFGRGFGGGESSATYMLDGKEIKTEVEGRMGKMPVTTKAKAEGNKLQLTSSSTFNGQMGEVTMTTKEKWELSSDGKTLTVETERSSPRGNESTTRVFSKKS